MNTLVNFETAKLLKEKGFDNPTTDCYNLNGLLFSNGWCEYIADDHEFDGLVIPEKLKEKDVLAPTVSETVMWLHEKHGIWISVQQNIHDKFEAHTPNCTPYDSPTEAYEVAIEYTLKNLV